MALTDIFTRVRSILYGQGLGEKPAFRQSAADAGESVTGQLVTFSLASGEGSKVKAGQVLSAYSPASESDAYVVYVTDVATDAVTGVNGYLGSPALGTGDADSLLWEQNPLVTGYEIFEAIDTVVARYLWPEVYNVETKTVANPDIVDGQEAVDADVMEILAAWQVVGPDNIRIPADRRPQTVNTAQKSTGRMAYFGWYDGSVGYYTAKTKIVEADEASTELTHLIALGAAAICLGASLVDTTIQGTKKDNVEAVGRRNQVGTLLWRDFLTLRGEHARELGRDHESSIVIDRG